MRINVCFGVILIPKYKQKDCKIGNNTLPIVGKIFCNATPMLMLKFPPAMPKLRLSNFAKRLFMVSLY
ncbi:hypothetical protein THIOM_005739 [Candidatus Thiomargarita nelsonii]|uniref:Uncharacterized protein n=1 Tax=Candidatus Thiomargarita nelsonii TaxID=1003181 RepID=A0A176RSG2_9GAMM|nr:hypothetical protein THIOM_005739 [Candidatus Thiomargarita nelsonii]